jgi:hypothetical protein
MTTNQTTELTKLVEAIDNAWNENGQAGDPCIGFESEEEREAFWNAARELSALKRSMGVDKADALKILEEAVQTIINERGKTGLSVEYFFGKNGVEKLIRALLTTRPAQQSGNDGLFPIAIDWTHDPKSEAEPDGLPDLPAGVRYHIVSQVINGGVLTGEWECALHAYDGWIRQKVSYFFDGIGPTPRAAALQAISKIPTDGEK